MRARLASLLSLSVSVSANAELRVPAYTAYLSPDANSARVSARRGITGWTGSDTKVQWFGEFKAIGEINCTLAVNLPAGKESKLKLTVGETSHELAVHGSTNVVNANLGMFPIKQAGYQRFTLESLNASGNASGDIDALILDGPAIKDAHFNLKERRNAASVHLNYSLPEQRNVAALYCEVTAVEDPLWSYYMACGWHRGYFGMQVNSASERRIIFSVWDSGNEPQSRSKVANENRVKLVGKGDGVFTGDFGNEGTGGHSHLKFNWRTGEKQRFIVTAKPVDESHTIYSGYYFRPDKNEWMLISSWNAPKNGSWLRQLHSFSENFGGANGHLQRKALFGNQWVKTDKGQWFEITSASFSHDQTGRADRLDRFMGVENGQFFLAHGGFVPGYTKYGEKFARPAIGTHPTNLPLEVTTASGK